jgi:hypothetical protein
MAVILVLLFLIVAAQVWFFCRAVRFALATPLRAVVTLLLFAAVLGSFRWSPPADSSLRTSSASDETLASNADAGPGSSLSYAKARQRDDRESRRPRPRPLGLRRERTFTADSDAGAAAESAGSSRD